MPWSHDVEQRARDVRAEDRPIGQGARRVGEPHRRALRHTGTVDVCPGWRHVRREVPVDQRPAASNIGPAMQMFRRQRRDDQQADQGQ